ncbi:MAG: hypothetical protein P0120_20680 [Nitrospira sp.]|nr:hypothetical protein [Nitrospira sp.]
MSTQPIWNPQQYAEHARFVTDIGAPLIDMLAPKPGERVLAVGCGDGVVTEQIRHGRVVLTPHKGIGYASDLGTRSF